MVSTKDLRDIFSDLTSEAGKQAKDAINKADLPDFSNIGRRSEPPGMLWFGNELVANPRTFWPQLLPLGGKYPCPSLGGTPACGNDP